jgi:hypothetical protein
MVITNERILARRAVAAPGFRWLPGMRTTCSRTVLDAGEGCARDPSVWVRGAVVRYPGVSVWPSDRLPDLTDPATLGCLLALVREAHPDAYAVRYRTNDDTGPVMWWRVVVPVAERPFSPGEPLVVAEEEGDFTTWAAGATEAEALVVALEAAPVRS